MSRDDFDLGDFGDLDSELPATDDAFLPPDTTPPAPRQPRNTTFLLIAVILVILFILGLVGIAAVVINNQTVQQSFQKTSLAIQMTNDFVNTAVAATSTAKSWTATPSPTPIPTDTFTPTSTNTPTDTPVPTLTPTVEITEATGTQATPGGTPLSDAAAQTATALAALAQTGTAFFNINASATCAADPKSAGCGGPITATTGGTVVAQNGSPTVNPRSLTRTAVALADTLTAQVPLGVASLTPLPQGTRKPTPLPRTGVFDDLSGGSASPSSLAVVGLAAVALVGVIFASRRLRIQAKK